jgi:hypothetical protein
MKGLGPRLLPLRCSFPELTFSGDDVLVSSGGDDDVHLAQDVLDPDHPKAVHASLESQGIKVSNILLCKTVKIPNFFGQFGAVTTHQLEICRQTTHRP